ncbi:AAA family ATPase [Alienimonas californiensis]|uniref:ATPase family associated with various cellular activities (AAA) n=1 Tax=Alienimonas californiensis TaxID=2527989 RepID=A0A517PC35_9PLAN|nr:MoxR family ATPase [Alienimonas californiensis]QDT16932.1 ATPase family associated with various cellular activities (AAA) [Alienimonas californiensis]
MPDPSPSPEFAPLARLREQVSRVLLGKPEPIRLALVALLGGGHILIEDAPGVGKTSLAKAIAKSLDGTFTRLQFTPDMLPSDILGASLFKPDMGEFEFRRGPIFTNVLLADEINRTTPRTQSALLEAMSEGQVSVEGATLPLEPPFFVIATQNPLESEGTYPLPDNQLDRFMVCTGIGYPDREHERRALIDHAGRDPLDDVAPVISRQELKALRTRVGAVRVDDSLRDYLLDIVEATRSHADLVQGASTRGALTFDTAARAAAVLDGRDYVTPDDVKGLAVPVLAHRLGVRGTMREGRREKAGAVVRQILAEVPVPG